MRANKASIKWTIIISVISLSISIIAHINQVEYFANLFMGIFASALLALMIAIINYSAERKKTLEKFYIYALKAVYNINKYENEGNLERTIDILLEMNQFDYSELDTALGEIDFIFANKENFKYIYNNIYKPILDLRDLISEKCWQFKEYRKKESSNKAVMEIFIREIDEIIMSRKETQYETDSSSTTYTTIRNQVVDNLQKELFGHYYDIMYWSKKPKV